MQIFIEAALIIVDETTPDDGLISYSYCYRCCCHPRGPSGLAVDNEDNVYVTENDNHRIQKFTSEGEFLVSWGSEGIGDGQFDRPEGLDVDPSGTVIVADTGNNRVQVFS